MSTAPILQPEHPQAPPERQFQPPTAGEGIRTGDGRLYWIGDPIGSGAFGSVYACTDEWGNSLAAKILHPRGDTYEQVRDRWLEEFNKLLVLRHPNVTFVHAAFEYRDTFYLVMERCAYSLHALIDPESENREIWIPYVARDVLQAVDFFHQSGYVHKDIHPGNVFVFQARDVMVPAKEPVWSFKVGDLGITRVEDEIRTVNTILADWMQPPEFLDPQFGRVCKSVDVYHVGLLLMSILLGENPLLSPEEIVQGRAREMAENLPSRYAGPISTALRRHVDARYQSALDFWRAIQAA
jgi:serine/threonine protein kinase